MKVVPETRRVNYKTLKECTSDEWEDEILENARNKEEVYFTDGLWVSAHDKLGTYLGSYSMISGFGHVWIW